MKTSMKIAAVGLFIGCIVAANWAVSQFGLVAAGFGLLVPAGTYFAGISLGLRDCVHELGGARLAFFAILLGAAVSALVADPRIAFASAAAFLASELLDLGVYTPLRERAWIAGVVLSGIAGAVVDTWVFLGLAGIPAGMNVFMGQLLAKGLYVAPVGILLVWVIRGRVLSRVP